MAKTCIFILARGGSTRIKNKNLSIIGGKTLIERTLDTCKELPYDTFVFTDSEKIKKISLQHGAEVRDKVYESPSGVHHTKSELLFYNESILADVIILLQVTSPFRDSSKVKIWIKDFLKSGNDCGVAAHPMRGFFYQGKCLYNQKDRDYNSTGEKTVYKETGSFYIFKKQNILLNHFVGGKIGVYEDPYNVDINTQKDLEKARGFYAETFCK